jgi:hypothetical protein
MEISELVKGLTLKVWASHHHFYQDMPSWFQGGIELPSLDSERAEAIAALFPKSVKVHVSKMHEYKSGTQSTVSYLRISASLGSDGVNGGRNETGIKRYRAMMKAAERAGIVIEWTAQTLDVTFATREEFEAAIS